MKIFGFAYGPLAGVVRFWSEDAKWWSKIADQPTLGMDGVGEIVE